MLRPLMEEVWRTPTLAFAMNLAGWSDGGAALIPRRGKRITRLSRSKNLRPLYRDRRYGLPKREAKAS